MPNGLFISYRRSDSAGFAGRIADYFTYRYPQIPVFFDATSIEPGQDFVESINMRLESSAVVLAPIGETWLDTRDAVSGERRIDNPNDFVRRELSMALARGARVIPLLLDNAQMPPASMLPDDLEPLARCNAQLMRHAAFARDVEHLGSFVVGHLETSTAPITRHRRGTALGPRPASERGARRGIRDVRRDDVSRRLDDLRSAIRAVRAVHARG